MNVLPYTFLSSVLQHVYGTYCSTQWQDFGQKWFAVDYRFKTMNGKWQMV